MDMDTLDQLIDKSLGSIKIKLSDVDKEKYKVILKQIIKDGKKPKDVLGFSDEMIEHIYSYGYRLFNLGNYKKARDVFLALQVLVPDDPRFSLALGSSYHRLKEYLEALRFYYMCGNQDKDNPMPFFYMYDCFMQGKFLGDAEICLQTVIARCGNRKFFAALKRRCQLTLDTLHKQMAALEAPQPIKEREEVKKAA